MKNYHYHDVVVIVGGIPHRIDDNYAYQLHCSRCGGWGLYLIWDGNEKKIGEEFGIESFKIMVGDLVICDTPGNPELTAAPVAVISGWNGVVTR